MKNKIIITAGLIILLLCGCYFINKDTYNINGFTYLTSQETIDVTKWNKYENNENNMIIKNPIFANKEVGMTISGMPIFGINQTTELTNEAQYYIPGIEESVQLPQGTVVNLSSEETTITLPGFPKQTITYSYDETSIIELNNNLYYFSIDGIVNDTFPVPANSALEISYNADSDQTYLTDYHGDSPDVTSYIIEGQFINIKLENDVSVVIDAKTGNVSVKPSNVNNDNEDTDNIDDPTINITTTTSGNEISATTNFAVPNEEITNANVQIINTATGEIDNKNSKNGETITFTDLTYDSTYLLQASVEYSKGTITTGWVMDQTGSFDNVNMSTTFNEISKNEVDFTVNVNPNEDSSYINSGSWVIVPEKIKNHDIPDNFYLKMVESYPHVVKTGTFTNEQINDLKNGKPVDITVDGLNPYWEYSVSYNFYTEDVDQYEKVDEFFVTSYQDPIIDVNFPNNGLIDINEDLVINFKIYNPRALPIEYITINDKQYDSNYFTVAPTSTDPEIYQGTITIPASDIEGGQSDLVFNSINFTNVDNRSTNVSVDVQQQINKTKITPEITNFTISKEEVEKNEAFNFIITLNNPDNAQVTSALITDPSGNTVSYNITSTNQTTTNGITTVTIPMVAGNQWSSSDLYTLNSLTVDTGTELIPNKIIIAPPSNITKTDSLIVYKSTPENYNLDLSSNGTNLEVCAKFDDVDNTMDGGNTKIEVKGPTATNADPETITTIDLVYDINCGGYSAIVTDLLPGTTYEVSWIINANLTDPSIKTEIRSIVRPTEFFTTTPINTPGLDVPIATINSVTATGEDKLTVKYQISDFDSLRNGDFNINVINLDDPTIAPIIIPIDSTYNYDGSTATQEITGLDPNTNYQIQINGSYQLSSTSGDLLVNSNQANATTLKISPTIDYFNLDSVDYSSANFNYQIQDPDAAIIPGTLRMQAYYESTNTLVDAGAYIDETSNQPNSATYQNLSEGKQYYIKVFAQVDLGNGPESIELTLPSSVEFLTWSHAPIGNFNVSQIDQTTMAINDVVVYDHDNARVGNFVIQAYEVQGSKLIPAGNPIEITNYDGVPQDYVYTGLDPNKTYIFKLQGKYSSDPNLSPIDTTVATSNKIKTLKITPTANIGTPIQNPDGTISVPVSVNDPQNARVINGVPTPFRLYATKEGDTWDVNDPYLTIRNYDGVEELYTFNAALLEYDTNYTFSLVGSYDLNKGTHINEVFGTTPTIKTIKEQPVGTITVTPRGDTEILVEAAVFDPNNSRTENFKIEVYEVNDPNTVVQSVDITNYSGTVNSFIISGLSPDVEYDVRLVGNYDLGLGLQSNYVFDSQNVKTFKSTPQANVSVTSPNTTTLSVDVNVNDPQNARTNDFEIILTDADDPTNSWTQTITNYDNTVETHTFTGLTPNHEYNIQIVGDFNTGAGLTNEYVFTSSNNKTLKTTPTATITQTATGTSTVNVQVNVNDPDNAHGSNVFKINVYQGNTLVQSKNITKYDGTTENFTFTGLNPNVNYTFKIEGIYDLNYGPSSNVVLASGNATTWKRTPTATVSVTYAGETKLDVKTTVNDPDGARSGNFQVQVYQGNTLVASQNITNYANGTQYFTFSGLRENTPYTVKVTGTYNTGSGTVSNTTVASTTATTRLNKRSPEVTFSNQGTGINQKTSIRMDIYDPDDALSNCTTNVNNSAGQGGYWTGIDYSTNLTSSYAYNVPGSTVTWKETCDVNLGDGTTHTGVEVATYTYYIPTNNSTARSPSIQFRNVENFAGGTLYYQARVYNPDNVPVSGSTITLYTNDSWTTYWDWPADNNWYGPVRNQNITAGTKYELVGTCTFNPGTGNVTTTCGSYTFYGTTTARSSLEMTNHEINDSYYKRVSQISSLE